MGRSLIETVQGLLERTYGLEGSLADVGCFLIGDDGLQRFYGDAPEADATVGTNEPQGARTFVRQTADGVRACVYYPDSLIHALESHPPQHGLNERNVDAFATLVEELDHLLLIAARARSRRPVTMFELELQANVSKHLVLARFLAVGGRLSQRRRLWLRHHLFDKMRYSDPAVDVRERYREATRWAVRFLERLARIDASTRLGTLRQFHVASLGGKMAQLTALS